MSKLERYKQINEPVEIPTEMNALILSGKGFENLQLKSVPVPQPNDNQFLARVDACFGCASDGKFIDNGNEHTLLNGWDLERWPVSIGHEGCITAVKVGKNLQDTIKVGNTFAIQPAIKTGPINHRERYKNNGEGIDRIAIGYSLGGLFAEYILITEEVIQTRSIIPYNAAKVPYFAAAFAESISCVYSAQNHVPHIYKKSLYESRTVQLGLKRGGVTLILGAGSMGIMHADLGMHYQPRQIIISEPIEIRREQARQILTEKAKRLKIELIITEPTHLPELLKSVNNGNGVDDCIVSLSIGKVQETAIQYLAPYGVANFFGGTKPEESRLTVDARRIHYDSVSMVGSSGGDPSDVVAVMELMEKGVVSPDRYIKRVGGLDQAFNLAQSIKNQDFFGKGLIYPQVRTDLRVVDSWMASDERNFLENKL